MFSEVLLHNTYLDYSTPHPGTGKGRPNQSQSVWVSARSQYEHAPVYRQLGIYIVSGAVYAINREFKAASTVGFYMEK